MSAGVYKIQCLENGKCYIGSSANIKSRKNNHFNLLKLNTHNSIELQSDYNLGKLFSFEVLRICNDPNQLKYYEKLATDAYDSINNGYNTKDVYNIDNLETDLQKQLDGFHLWWLADNIKQPDKKEGMSRHSFYSYVYGKRTPPHWLLKELSRLTKRNIKYNEKLHNRQYGT